MSDVRDDEEPSATIEGNKSIKGRKTFARLDRQLSAKELASPIVQKLLLDELDRLESEVVRLRDYETKFHEVDKRHAILEERRNKNNALETLSSAGLAIGGAMLGYVPSIWSVQPAGYYTIIFGGAVLAGGIIAKVMSR